MKTAFIMAARKKEKVEKPVYEPTVHPNAGMVVNLNLFHMGENSMVKKPGLWNGTHWVFVDKKTGVTSSIPPHLRIKSWTE